MVIQKCFLLFLNYLCLKKQTKRVEFCVSPLVSCMTYFPFTAESF